MNKLKAIPAVGSMRWLGELWTSEDITDARYIWSCVCEGADCSLTINRLRELEKRGLVEDVKVKPGRGRYANRYEYLWADKLKGLLEAVQASSPNGGADAPRI